MTVAELKDKLGLSVAAGAEGLSAEVTGGYCGDLLSWVMGKAGEGNAWFTICGHVNIVAVALLTGVSCIVVCEDGGVEPDTIAKADKEDIPVLTTGMSVYEAAAAFSKL